MHVFMCSKLLHMYYEFGTKLYFSNVNGLFGYVSLLTNETLAVMS